MAEKEHQWWTIEEVAGHYHKTVDTIRYWRHTGYGPRGTKVGTTILWPQSEIDRFDAELEELARNVG